MAKFKDIKLNDIVTVEANSIRANFKILVVHYSTFLSRLEFVGLAESDIGSGHNILCLSGPQIAANVKNVIEAHKKNSKMGTIEHVAGLEKYSTLYLFYSNENENFKLISIKESGFVTQVNRANDFTSCKRCREPVYMAGPNQSDGSFICYSCRENPIRIYY